MNSFINYRNIWVCALFTLLSTSGILAQGEKEDNSLEFDVLKAAEVSNLENVNTKHFETAPAIYGNGIVYIWTQKRKAGLYDKNINAAFFDLKYADLSNSFAEPIVFNEQLNDAYHMSPVCFYEEGQKMLLALNNTKEKGQDGFYQMNLMTASKDSIGNWNVEEQFIYNESNYTIYHPTLSEDGKMLVFASNMSGGFGKLDLYFCLKIDNVWGAPINMGPYINTEGNDAFPRLYGDWVFFASDSRQGYGGYDIYASTNKNGVWGFPDNIGAPINSEKDDLGLIFAEDGMTGYFTSARDGGKGLDDIYKVSLSSPVVYKTPKPEDQPKPLLNFTVTIKDQRSKTNLKNAEVQLLPIDVNQNDLNSGDFNVNVLQHDKRTGEITVKLTPRMLASDKLIKIITDDKGSATASLEDGLSYMMIVSKEGFVEDQNIISVHEKMSPEVVYLEKKQVINAPKPKSQIVSQPTSPNNSSEETELFIPTESGSKIVFENVYYDLNSANIKAGAAAELDALAIAMIDNPSMRVRLEAHTDVRGNAAYNRALSEERAASAKKYLVRKGIQSRRVETRGYGEDRIRNHCTQGVRCSEKEHAFNRRTEVTIL